MDMSVSVSVYGTVRPVDINTKQSNTNTFTQNKYQQQKGTNIQKHKVKYSCMWLLGEFKLISLCFLQI